MTLHEFITLHQADDINRLALQRNRYPFLTDTDFRFALRQIEGRQRTRSKLPSVSDLPDWHYPARLSLEQCSSEVTARYKASLVEGRTLADLTGGMGIDTLFLSARFRETCYVERQEELCTLAAHNFGMLQRNISIHCTDAGMFLEQMQPVDVIYLDPARRSAAGGKVFRVEDCEPDIIGLLPLLRTLCSVLLVKLSPMLDIAAALRSLPDTAEVHVVAVKNEVKELLLLCRFTSSSFALSDNLSATLSNNLSDNTPTASRAGDYRVISGSLAGCSADTTVFHAVNLLTSQPSFTFRPADEQQAECLYADNLEEYLLEPNAAILKAGAFRLAAMRYSLSKLAPNTHLYTASRVPDNFPGRVWRLRGPADKKSLRDARLNILSRNHPLAADQLRRRFALHDGDTDWLIATRIGTTPVLLLAEQLR